MASSPLPETHNARAQVPEHLTLGWLAKRSAAWLFIVAVGVGAACALYAYAGEADAPIETSSIQR